jgi:hypothetical protein
MKIKFILFYLFINVSNVFATDIFEEVSTKSDFSELSKVEKFLETHESLTLADIKISNPELLANLELVESANPLLLNTNKDMPLVGGFWWGCCLGVVGLALVYFITDNNKSQVRPALWGCLIFTVLGGSIYGFWNPFGW